MAKHILRRAAKYLLISTIIVASISILTLFFTYLALGYLTPIHIFTANFIVGGLAIIMGLYSLLSPSARLGGYGRASGSRWLDYSTNQMLTKTHRRDEPEILKFIYVGIGIISITGLTQFLLSLIVR